MERDSRRWVFDCRHCETTSSIWDVGGIRWKAAGTPRRGIKCPACGRKSIVRIRWSPAEDPVETGED
jgi:hypothetical protein